MIGNRGNRGPRPWNLAPWNADEYRRLRTAAEACGDFATDAEFWRQVAAAMGTGRSPAAVERRAGSLGLRAKVRAQ